MPPFGGALNQTTHFTSLSIYVVNEPDAVCAVDEIVKSCYSGCVFYKDPSMVSVLMSARSAAHEPVIDYEY